MNELNIKEKWEEHKYITTSLIRLLDMMDCSEDTLHKIHQTSKKLKKIEENGGVVSDEKLYELYCQYCEERILNENHK